MRAYRLFSPGALILQAALLMLLLAGPAAIALGQTDDAGNVKPLLLFPQPLPERAYWQSAGFSGVAPPPEITEELQIRWPAFEYRGLYGLPYGFVADGKASVQVLQNRISLGPRWASTIGPVSFSLGYDVAYWFGFLTVGGFDSKAHGWQGGANASVGYKFGDIAATVKAELLSDFSVATYQSDLEVSTNRKTISGAAFTFALEQPFYKQQYLTLGFRAIYTKFYWETWSLYSTFDRYLFFPEIFVGFIL